MSTFQAIYFNCFTVFHIFLKFGFDIYIDSAGVGRTGTFLAIDNLLKEAAATGRISIPQAVVTLRKQRVNMVQSLVSG